MEDVAPVSEDSSRMEPGVEEGSMNFGEYNSSEIQAAIHDGNRKRHAFFVVKMGKCGVAMPYQQLIPADFAKHHPNLHLADVELEVPDGRSWGVTIRPQLNAVRFGKGWRQFSIESHLREGHQLLFHLVGTSRFVVRFFDNLGKGLAMFPPLPPSMPDFAEPSQRDEEESAPFEPIPIAKPRPKPAAKPPALDSVNAKVILRQFFTQVHDPNLSPEVPTHPTEDTMKEQYTIPDSSPVRNQGRYEEHTTEGGKGYVFLSSDDDHDHDHDDEDDDDDDFDEQEDVPLRFKRTPSKRTGNKSVGGSRTGFHSPEKTRKPRPGRKTARFVPEKKRVKDFDQDFDQDHMEEIHEENDYYTRSKYRERQTPARKKASTASMRRAAWQGKDSHGRDSFAKSGGHGRHGSIRDEKTSRTNVHSRVSRKAGARDSSSRADDLRARGDGGGSYSGATVLSPADLLLRQQDCVKYSDIIISKRKRGRECGEERQKPLTAATRFAANLRNESFVVALKSHQVYHGFYLPIPRDFVEVTGTLKVDKVKVRLIDSEKTFYNTKWRWHASCQTPLLNCDGWAKFALDHNLGEGDVCVFELLDTNPVVDPDPVFLVSVHIFNVVEIIDSSRDNTTIRERCGTPSNIPKFRRQKAPAAPVKNSDRDQLRCDRGKNRTISDHQLGRHNLKKTIQKPHNLQQWTKLFKPRAKAQAWR